MAIMDPEGITVQKMMPIQSPGKMDVNGNSNGFGLDLNKPPEQLEPPKPVEISPLSSDDFNSSDGNLLAFASNNHHAIDAPSTESSQQSSSTNFAQPSTTTTLAPTTQDAQSSLLLASELSELQPVPAAESAIEAEIYSALDDTAATSTVPPIVEAPESDLRDTTSPLALPKETPIDPPPTAHPETKPELPIASMDGATDSTDAQNVALSNGSAILNNVPSFDTPSTNLAPITQDQQPAVSHDAEMTDAPEPAQFTKVSREREDDAEDEPSAKRAKTEEDNTIANENPTKGEDDTPMADISAPDFPAAPEVAVASEASALPGTPSAIVVPVTGQAEEKAPAKSDSSPAITPYQAKEIIKVLKNQVRSKSGMNFKGPVAELWPAISEAYLAKVSHPVDLATMESKLKGEKYATLDEFKAEVKLIYENTLTYNGETHDVTIAGRQIRDAILKKLETIPPEPVVQKAAKKQRKSTPLSEPAPRASAPRRQSKSGGAAPATAAAAAAATTFALDPNTSTPLIRRDSTKLEGGRPKREIHPPKHKDLIYSNASRPKNKKVAQELKFCEEILAELKKPKHAAFADAFKVPVDPVSLNIPNYFSIIKHPMDLSTIENKVKSCIYSSTKEFERDMKLMFANCYKFNPAPNVVNSWGKQLEAVYNEAWATKSKWFADHAPAEDPSSIDGSEDEESEEEVEAEEPAASSAITALSERLTEEQEKLIALLTNPKKNAQMIEMQKEMIQMLKDKLAVTKAKAPATKKAVKKTKPAKPAKKQATAKKGGSSAAKKQGGRRPRYLGTLEKNIISLGITRLPDDITKEILAMIKSETDVAEGDDGEVELDIDVVSIESLWKIYEFIVIYSPESVLEANQMLDDAEDEPPAKSAKPPAKKKNKPMSKNEQERKLEQLDDTLQSFQRHASGSQEPLPTVEPQDQSTPADESSGDESDSEED